MLSLMMNLLMMGAGGRGRKGDKAARSRGGDVGDGRDQGLIRPQAIYRIFPANGEGNDLILFDPQGTGSKVMRFTFPRQPGEERLCLADFGCLGLHRNSSI